MQPVHLTPSSRLSGGAWRCILLGLTLCLTALVLMLGATPAQAQDAPTADYEGAEACAACHRDMSRIHIESRHGLALQDAARNKKAITADFSTGEELRSVLFPGEAAPRPFAAKDISLVIGSGRYVERYVYKEGRNTYAILPAQWNVEKQVWEPYVRAELWTPEEPAYNFVTNCGGCHTTGLNAARARWDDNGVQCEACHGPASLHVEQAKAASTQPTAEQLIGIRSTVALSPDAQVCGQCHGAGTDPATAYPFPSVYRPGGNLLDEAVYKLVAGNDSDHWWATGHARLSNMQYNEWLLSGHAAALDGLKTAASGADPACLSCHSSDYVFTARLIEEVNAGTRVGPAPAPTTLETARFGVTCVGCHDPHQEKTETTPDFSLVAEPYTLCTSCHSDNVVTPGLHHPVKEMFEGTKLFEDIEGQPSKHFTDENGAKCVDCHMADVPVENGAFSLATHTDKPVLPATNIEGLVDVCTTCHTDVTANAMEKFVTDSQEDTRTRIEALKVALKDDSPAWIKEAITFIEGDGSWGIHNHRYVATILDAAERAILPSAVIQPGALAPRTLVSNPSECAECHQKEHETWLTSPHATATLSENFRAEFARINQPTFCMSCHASGFDAATNTYVFDGVVCSTCHYTEANAVHPPAPVNLANRSADCGRCHSGAHAPAYDEWLSSAHREARVDCIDCHTPHDNGLRQGTVNATCGNCHEEATKDAQHMGENMACTDCHMSRKLDAAGVFVVKSGHTMQLEPEVCSDCHGNIHTGQAKIQQTAGEKSPLEEIGELETKIRDLETQSQINWAVGLAGGAVGVLIIVALGLFILRRGKVL